MVNWLKGIFEEGTPQSWSRFGSFLALLACIGWDSYCLHYRIPLPGSLTEQALFIGTLYGLGKVGSTIVSGIKANSNGSQPAGSP